MKRITAAVIGSWFLAGAAANAQPPATPAAETSPPSVQASRPDVRAATPVGPLRFEVTPKFLTGVPVGTHSVVAQMLGSRSERSATGSARAPAPLST